MTPLERYPAARRFTYDALWLVGLVLTVAQGWVFALDRAQPDWLTVALGTFPAVASYVGYQAKKNTPEPEEQGPDSTIPGTTLPNIPAEPLDGPNQDYERG